MAMRRTASNPIASRPMLCRAATPPPQPTRLSQTSRALVSLVRAVDSDETITLYSVGASVTGLLPLESGDEAALLGGEDSGFVPAIAEDEDEQEEDDDGDGDGEDYGEPREGMSILAHIRLADAADGTHAPALEGTSAHACLSSTRVRAHGACRSSSHAQRSRRHRRPRRRPIRRCCEHHRLLCRYTCRPC